MAGVWGDALWTDATNLWTGLGRLDYLRRKMAIKDAR
jgi:hypothetical protein